VEDHAELACGIKFFVVYAYDHLSFRKYLIEPNVFATLISRLKTLDPDGGNTQRSSMNWEAIVWICKTFSTASRRDWLVPTLLDLDICNVLVQLLGYVITTVFALTPLGLTEKLISRVSSNHRFSPTNKLVDYHIIMALRNLAVDKSGRLAVNAVTLEIRKALQDLEEWPMSRMAQNVQSWLSEILGSGYIKG
jgi:hypothetical protein